LAAHTQNKASYSSSAQLLYDDAHPSAMQAFFLTHKELNIAEFARYAGINATLLRNYINGYKKPSPEREKAILESIHRLGRELVEAEFKS